MDFIEQFLYQPKITHMPHDFSPETVVRSCEDIYFQTADNITLNGWYLPAKKPFHVMVFCHGNGGNIRDWFASMIPFVLNGCSVFLFDYRGYGNSKGKPSEKGLFLDGQAAWDWVSQRAINDHLPASILGKSLGGAVAASIASRNHPTSLTLDSTFTSFNNLVKEVAPWIPSRLIPDVYRNIDIMNKIQCPTLVIHGGADHLVPPEHGHQLYKALCCPKILRIIPKADHNDIDQFQAYGDVILEFLTNPEGITHSKSIKIG